MSSDAAASAALAGEVCLPTDGMAADACAFCPPVRRGEQPAWHPPAPDGGASVCGLRVHNSLTRSKELFVPAQGRRVRWYTCGPTVYDVSHMGHARAYLTFDILRRVLEEYFGYEVEYQMNVTDIDDKIILRARRNKLLADYRAANKALADVTADVDAAMLAMDAKLAAKLAVLEAPLPAGTSSLLVDERAELLEMHRLKLEQWKATQASVAEARAGTSAAALIDAAVEPLAERLDSLLGESVTDQAVFEAHARRFEADFFEDMQQLGVRPPTILTRVTEYVPEIVAFIEAIIAKGMAYESNGSVYMEISALKAKGHEYRKLMPAGADDTTDAQMSEGEGELGCGGSEKRSRNDFALWKASKPGEPSWPSPWGGGRPGWHIECSVMGSATFGKNMDVHAGGSDLKFPHHDNELAQSEAYHGCAQWVNYFLHAGHLHIKGLKMSKSLKNFVTIKQALASHSARQIRLMFLLQPWDRPMQYSDQTIGEARAVERKLRDFFGAVKALRRAPWLSGPTAPTAAESALAAKVSAFRQRAHAALLDNFNTAGVMSEMLALCADVSEHIRAASKAAAAGAVVPGALVCSDAAVAVTRLLRVFGVAEQDELGLPLTDEGGGSREMHVTPFAEALVRLRDELRQHAKQAKDGRLLALCDEMRDATLVKLGVRVEDPTGGEAESKWRLDEPAVLQRELAERRERQRDKEREGLAQKLATKKKARAGATRQTRPTPRRRMPALRASPRAGAARGRRALRLTTCGGRCACSLADRRPPSVPLLRCCAAPPRRYCHAVPVRAGAREGEARRRAARGALPLGQARGQIQRVRGEWHADPRQRRRAALELG